VQSSRAKQSASHVTRLAKRSILPLSIVLALAVALLCIRSQFGVPGLSRQRVTNYGDGYGTVMATHGVNSRSRYVELFVMIDTLANDPSGIRPSTTPPVSTTTRTRANVRRQRPGAMRRDIPGQSLDFLGFRYGSIRLELSPPPYVHPGIVAVFSEQRVLRIPWWSVLVAGFSPAILVLIYRRAVRARHRIAKGLCPRCAYELADLGACPECNWQRPKSPAQPPD